jgi:hypothetical protein
VKLSVDKLRIETSKIFEKLGSKENEKERK